MRAGASVQIDDLRVLCHEFAGAAVQGSPHRPRNRSRHLPCPNVSGVGTSVSVNGMRSNCKLYVQDGAFFAGEQVHIAHASGSYNTHALVVVSGSGTRVYFRDSQFAFESVGSSTEMECGVMVLQRGAVVLTQCMVRQVYTGVRVHLGAQAVLSDCEVYSNSAGVRVAGAESLLRAVKCRIRPRGGGRAVAVTSDVPSTNLWFVACDM